MTIHEQIQQRIEAFAQELEKLVRSAAIESVRDALGEGGPRAAPARRAPSAASAPAAAPKATPSPKRKAGGKRDPKEIDALTARLASWIAANGGKRVEEIGKALNTPTKELALPIIRLLDNKTIKKSGVKRATKYFAR